TSFGQLKPTQRFARTFVSQSFMKLAPRARGGGRLSRRNARTSSRNACSSFVSSKSIFVPFSSSQRNVLCRSGRLQPAERCDALVVIIGIAVHRPRPLRAFQIQLSIVLRRETDGAMQLHAVDADLRKRIRGIPLRQRRRSGELGRRFVDSPRGVVQERF